MPANTISLVDIAQIAATLIAGFGLILVGLQFKRQTDQLHSDRLISLYQDLDTPQSRADRMAIYTTFGDKYEYTDSEADVARRVLASLDRMSYQVLRGFADRQAAYDLYGRVLMRVMQHTWTWLDRERLERDDPKGWEYCGNAERLAVQFARLNLWHRRKWGLFFKRMAVPELMQRSLDAHRYVSPAFGHRRR